MRSHLWAAVGELQVGSRDLQQAVQEASHLLQLHENCRLEKTVRHLNSAALLFQWRRRFCLPESFLCMGWRSGWSGNTKVISGQVEKNIRSEPCQPIRQRTTELGGTNWLDFSSVGVASASSSRLPLELRTLGTQQSFKTTVRHQGAASTLALLTLHQLEVTWVIAEELVTDRTRTRAPSLQPLLSKQLKVVKLRPSTLLRQDLGGNPAKKEGSTHTYTSLHHNCNRNPNPNSYIAAVEDEHSAQFSN